jgi:hypothetical protein
MTARHLSLVGASLANISFESSVGGQLLIEPAPLAFAIAILAAILVGRLLRTRAPLPAALFAAALGGLLGEAIGERLPVELLSVGGLAWPAPLLGAVFAERFAARIASDWERGRRP